jgi:DNA-binding transcriptional LysR family regulator
LRVTHSAVSRAVRSLEDHLSVQLMIRTNRSVWLTPILFCRNRGLLTDNQPLDDAPHVHSVGAPVRC